MRGTRGTRKRSAVFTRWSSAGMAKRWCVFTSIILFSIGALALYDHRFASAVTDERPGGLPNSLSIRRFTATQDYSKFSHSSPKEHWDVTKDLNGRSRCGSCHRRSDSSPAPRFPVHKDCTGCHLVQFTSSSSAENPICTICHTKEGINLPKPLVRNFSVL